MANKLDGDSLSGGELSAVPKCLSPESLSLLSDQSSGKNKTRILCKRCPSVVLIPQQATLVKREFFLPNMYQKNVEAQPIEGVNLSDFWLVTDMMHFENVGFTKTVDDIKYLICADCEVGPIGWHCINDKAAYFIAVDRVKHDD